MRAGPVVVKYDPQSKANAPLQESQNPAVEKWHKYARGRGHPLLHHGGAVVMGRPLKQIARAVYD